METTTIPAQGRCHVNEPFGFMGVNVTMAQTTCFGPSPWFDIHWEPRVKMAASVLAKIQDSWVITGSDFPSEHAAAVMLYIFDVGLPTCGRVRGVTRADVNSRSVADWFSAVSDAVTEASKLLPSRSISDHQDIASKFTLILGRAGVEWEDCITSPTCEEVIRNCLDYLTSKKYVVLRRG